jgi:hypothetical protein
MQVSTALGHIPAEDALGWVPKSGVRRGRTSVVLHPRSGLAKPPTQKDETT